MAITSECRPEETCSSDVDAQGALASCVNLGVIQNARLRVELPALGLHQCLLARAPQLGMLVLTCPHAHPFPRTTVHYRMGVGASAPGTPGGGLASIGRVDMLTTAAGEDPADCRARRGGDESRRPGRPLATGQCPRSSGLQFSQRRNRTMPGWRRCPVPAWEHPARLERASPRTLAPSRCL